MRTYRGPLRLSLFEGTAIATAGELRLYRTCGAVNVLLVPVLAAAGVTAYAAACAVAAVYAYAWLAVAHRPVLRAAWDRGCPVWRMARLVAIGDTGVFQVRWRAVP